MTDVRERGQVPWRRRVRVAAPAAAEDELNPGILLELGSRAKENLCPLPPSARRRDDECVGIGLQRSDERGRVAVLACQDELRAGQDRLAPSEASERLLVTGSRGPRELLGPFPKLLEIHDDLPPSSPTSALPGGRRDRFVDASC